MKKYWKVLGVLAIVAGILYYPAVKLYQFITGQKREDSESEADIRVRMFNPAYGGKTNPEFSRSANSEKGRLV